MNIYTGQFIKAGIYVENDYLVCSVARYDPPWFTGFALRELAPSKELLSEYKAGLSFGQFAKQYLAYLETVDFDSVMQKLESLSDEFSGVVLCCHENKTQFCHRHLLANYLNSHYMLGVTEI